MNHEAGLIDRLVTDQDVAGMIDQLKIRDLDLAEKLRQRIDPEAAREFRVAHGDMPGETLVEAVAREQAESGRKPLLAVQPLLFKRGGRRTCRSGRRPAAAPDR